MRTRCDFSLAWLAGWLALCVGVPVALAQSPIRVESTQVLVPVVVFDKKLYTLADSKHNKQPLSSQIARDPHLWDTIAVRGLEAKDFHLFQDGHEQSIQSVRFETSDFSIVRDNLGRHPETIGDGGGRWSYPDLADSDHSMWLPWPQYVIAYAPPESRAGSCHSIQVNMSRANLVVWARSEYCNTPHPASDPLNGTKFGKQLEDELASRKESKIDVKLDAVVLYGDAKAPRVSLRMEFPAKSLRHEFKNGTLYETIGALGVIYNQDGSVATRFSDFACCDYGNESKPSAKASSATQSSETTAGREVYMIPNGFATQLELPPGEYRVRMALSDGEKFGRIEIPLTVREADEKHLAISEIALCRRIHRFSEEEEEIPAKLARRYVPLVSRGVEFTPTVSSRFQKSEMLYAYFEVLDPQHSGATPGSLKAQLKIVDAKTGELRIGYQDVDTAPYAKANSSLVPIARGIDLSNLSNGEYRLEVRATDATGRSTEWRRTNFVVDEFPPLEQLLKLCAVQGQC